MARTVATDALVKIMGRLVKEERASRGISRRGFIAGVAGAVGAAACGPAPDAKMPSSMEGPVVVVGGGTAGLVCAYRLMQANVPVVVLEGSNRPGGRMLTDRKTFGPSLVCELGGEFVDTGHKTMQALAKELGLELDDVKVPAEGLAPVFHFGGKAHAEADVIAALRPAAAALTKDMEGLDLADLPYESGPKTKALDALSITAWLEARGIKGLGADILRLAFTTELGLEPEELSCITMLQMFSLEGDKMEMYGESDERFHIRGGNDQIPRLLADKLGDKVKYETRLKGMRRDADGRVELSVGGAGPNTQMVTERLVIAIPFTMLRTVEMDRSMGFSERKMRSIKELGYGTNAKMMLGFASRYWEADKKNGEIFTDGPFQSTWDTSRAQKGAQGILTVFTGGKIGVSIGQGEPNAKRDEIVPALDAVIPGAKAATDGKVARFHWPTSPLVLGSYASWRVGQMTAFGGSEAEIEGKNVHFAGEHTSLEAQGFMEGAAESGERAATEVIAALRG